MFQWDCGIRGLPVTGIGDNAVVRKDHQLGSGHQDQLGPGQREKKTLRVFRPGEYLRLAYCVRSDSKRFV